MHWQKQKKLKLKQNVSSCHSLYSEGQLNALWQENSKICGGNKDNQENNNYYNSKTRLLRTLLSTVL